MKASVIIPAYKCLPQLKRTLKSLEKQDIPISEFEVITIDDFSGDGTAIFLESYEGNLNLKPIINDRNYGRAVSRNRGIETSKGETIVFLDADMEVRPDFLRMHLSYEHNRPHATVGRVVFHPDIHKIGFMRYLEKRGGAKLQAGSELPGKYFLSCNSSVPAEILKKIGGFDEGFKEYGGEDLELGIRIAENIPIYYVPEAVTYHNHLRTLDEYLKIWRKYGEFSLPYLIEKQPQILKDLRLDNIPPRTLSDIIKAFLCFSPIYNSIKMLAKLDKMPDFLYSYLIFRNYREGYRKSKKVVSL